MDKVLVVEAEMVNNQTIHIFEPLNLSFKKVLVTIQPLKKERDTKIKEKYKGKVVLSDDFDQSLDDFKDYMK